MSFWSSLYTRKSTLQGSDMIPLQDSTNRYTDVDAIKDYVEDNSTVINSLTNTVINTITSSYLVEYNLDMLIPQNYGKTGRYGIVSIDGYLNGTVAAWSTLTLFTLPDGFRPVFTVSYPMTVDGNAAPIYLIVNTDGTVMLRNSSVTDFTSAKVVRVVGSACYIV